MTYIFSLSILFQLMAAFFCIKLIRYTGKRIAWILIATAIVMMVFRRVIAFSDYLNGIETNETDIIIGLILSLLFMTGMYLAVPIFIAARNSEILRRQMSEIIEFLPDATFVIDKDKKIIAWNKALEEMTGVPKEKMLGKGNYEYAIPFWSERQSIFIDFLNSPDEDIPERYSNIVRHNGKLHAEVFAPSMYKGKGADVWLAASAIYDGQGNIIGAIECVRDITRIKEAEKALVDAELKFRKLTESSLVGVYIVSDSVFEYVNPIICQIFGYSESEMIGMNVNNLAHPDSRPLIEENIRKRLSREVDVVRYEAKCIKKDGSVIICEVLGNFSTINNKSVLIGNVVDITERRNAESALKESAERLKLATSAARIGVWDWDIVNSKLVWDDSMISMHSAGTASFSGNFNSAMNIHSDDMDRVNVEIALALKSEPEFSSEFRVILRDKTERHIKTKSNIYRDEDGNPVRMVGVNIDITEQKRVEQAMEKRLIALTSPFGDLSNIQFDDLFNVEEIQSIQDAFSEATGVASLITDVNGNPITRPSNFCHLCQNIIRKTEKGLANCIHSDIVLGKGYINGPNVQPCKSGGLWDGGASILVGDKHIANWLIGQVVDDSADIDKMLEYAKEIGADEDEFRKALKKVTRMPVARFKLISDALYKIAEQMSKLATQNVQQARYITEIRVAGERLKLATNAARLGVWDWDILNNKLIWDESMYNLYGIKKNEFQATIDAWQKCVHPDDFDFVMAEIQAAHQGIRDYTPEFRIVRPDGTVVFMKAESKTYFDESGRAVRMIGTNMDITERKREEEMRKAKEAADAANKAKSDFLANVSHELRNPLNSIIGLANSLSRTETNENTRKMVEGIKVSSGNLLNIINDVLDFSKIEAGMIELNAAQFEIAEICNDVFTTFKAQADYKGIAFLHTIENDVPKTLLGDGKKLKQIMINLVSNAIKFTDAGSVSFSVRAETKVGSSSVLLKIAVTDTGIGIREKDFVRLFKSFSQVDSSTTKQYAGTGLGLAIVQEFVGMMNGKISFVSTYGKGSTFTLEVPFEISQSIKENHTATNEIPSALEGSILIVEDDGLNQLYLTSFLKMKGMKVESAFNGKQAVEKCKQATYDIILMDGQMPEMDGFEATRMIRTDEIEKKIHTPIIAITGYAITGDIERFLGAGMDDYISKPIDENRLLTLIYKYLKEK